MQLSNAALRCLGRIEYYSRLSGEAFPFQSTLAHDLGFTDRHVRRALSELRRAGVISVQKRGRTSAKIILDRTLCPVDVRSNVRSSGSYPITEVVEVFNTQPAAAVWKSPQRKPTRRYDPYQQAEHERRMRDVTEPVWGVA